jgi:DnaJ-class molecular chaperone
VKQAYRSLAKIWHPDRFAYDLSRKQQAETKIKTINEAYRQLKLYQFESEQPFTSQSTSQQTSRTEVATRSSNAETCYNRGAENVKAGKYKEALDDFSTAIRLNSDYAEAYRYRGFVNSLLGFELGAEADLAKAAKLGLQQNVASRSSSAQTTNGSTSQQPQPSSAPRSTAQPEVERRSPTPPPWHCVKTLQITRTLFPPSP